MCREEVRSLISSVQRSGEKEINFGVFEINRQIFAHKFPTRKHFKTNIFMMYDRVFWMVKPVQAFQRKVRAMPQTYHVLLVELYDKANASVRRCRSPMNDFFPGIIDLKVPSLLV